MACCTADRLEHPAPARVQTPDSAQVHVYRMLAQRPMLHTLKRSRSCGSMRVRSAPGEDTSKDISPAASAPSSASIPCSKQQGHKEHNQPVSVCKSCKLRPSVPWAPGDTVCSSHSLCLCVVLACATAKLGGQVSKGWQWLTDVTQAVCAQKCSEKRSRWPLLEPAADLC